MKKMIAYAGLCSLICLFASCEKAIQDQQPEKNAKTEKMMAGKAIGGKVVWASAIPLSGLNEVPANNAGTKGVAILQVTEARKLYSKVQVSSLADDDAIRFGHIHRGAAGINGPVMIFLLHTANDIGMQMEIDLTEAQYQSLLNDALYVNVHSIKFPGGIIRGQIR